MNTILCDHCKNKMIFFVKQNSLIGKSIHWCPNCGTIFQTNNLGEEDWFKPSPVIRKEII